MVTNVNKHAFYLRIDHFIEHGCVKGIIICNQINVESIVFNVNIPKWTFEISLKKTALMKNIFRTISLGVAIYAANEN